MIAIDTNDCQYVYRSIAVSEENKIKIVCAFYNQYMDFIRDRAYSQHEGGCYGYYFSQYLESKILGYSDREIEGNYQFTRALESYKTEMEKLKE